MKNRKKGGCPAALISCLFLLLSAVWIGADTLTDGRLMGTADDTVRVTVPSLVGQVYDADGSATDPALFALSVTYVYSNEPARRVLDQSPTPGAVRKVIPGERPVELHLTVSMGKELHRVPDTVGLTIREAEKALQDSGLSPSVRTVTAPSESRSGRVLYTEPAAGTCLSAGDTVLLYATPDTPRPTALCPALAGLSLPEAWGILLDADLELGEVTLSPDPLALPGTVLSQSLAPGASLPIGTAVGLTVAVGERGSEGAKERRSVGGLLERSPPNPPRTLLAFLSTDRRYQLGLLLSTDRSLPLDRKGVAGCSAEHPAVAFEPLRGTGYQITCVALARGAEMSGFLLR